MGVRTEQLLWRTSAFKICVQLKKNVLNFYLAHRIYEAIGITGLFKKKKEMMSFLFNQLFLKENYFFHDKKYIIECSKTECYHLYFVESYLSRFDVVKDLIKSYLLVKSERDHFAFVTIQSEVWLVFYFSLLASYKPVFKIITDPNYYQIIILSPLSV